MKVLNLKLLNVNGPLQTHWPSHRTKVCNSSAGLFIYFFHRIFFYYYDSNHVQLPRGYKSVAWHPLKLMLLLYFDVFLIIWTFHLLILTFHPTQHLGLFIRATSNFHCSLLATVLCLQLRKEESVYSSFLRNPAHLIFWKAFTALVTFK